MIHSLVFSVWTSTLSLKDLEAESVSEEDANQESEPNTESQKTKLWNGSEENTMVLSITDSCSLFKYSYFKQIIKKKKLLFLYKNIININVTILNKVFHL